MSFSTDVETVCTHAELAEELAAGSEGLARLAKLTGSVDDGSGSTTAPMRQRAMEETLKAFYRRTPPIEEQHLRDKSQLRDAVIYGALERLYEEASGSAEDAYAMKAKSFGRRFRNEVSNMRPKLVDSGRGPVLSYPMGRR